MWFSVCLLLKVAAVCTANAGTCDFENGLCGYTHDQNSDFEWTNNTGVTTSFNTGPLGDHTTGSGSYMYIETSSPRLNREAAHLVSPQISATDGNCLSFYFHMFGLNIRELSVYTQSISGSRHPLWRLNGDHGEAWHNAAIPLSIPKDLTFKIVFEGIVGTGYMGDIAIDDIMVEHTNKCDINPPSAQPQPPQPTPVPTPPFVPFCGVKPHTRIVGGAIATPNSWPWQAMLMYQKDTGEWKQFCGGSLVLHDWVLTAAHCVNSIRGDDYSTHMVRLGAHYKNTSLLIGSEQDFGIKKIYFHHEYNSVTNYNYDVALIHLDRPAILMNGVGLVCLPDDNIEFSPGADCWITGWGTLQPGGASPDELQEAKVPLVSNKECTKNGSYEASKITREMLCAGFPEGGIDACQGDSGGPLVCEDNGKWYLMGDTSWGYSCAKPNYYGVYARLALLKDWVFHILTNPDSA
nr:CUB and peptidase domain-containing protein 2-like isoform X2 [Pocillopora verrucosa]